jgi:nicotinamidase-related amidase
MDRVLPITAALGNRHPERTVFTRFIPPEGLDEMPGMWQRYYTRWRHATRERLDLQLRAPRSSAAGIDAATRGALSARDRYRQNTLLRVCRARLIEHMRQREADGLIVSGSETDVCVLATVLDAVDVGYRVIVVRDAVCSSSDEGHDMLMRLYHTRYTEQIETADAAAILARWE